MITKGCIYDLVHVHDIDAESLALQFILVVNDFLNVFPDKLPCIPPERNLVLLSICYQVHNPYISLLIEWILQSLRS